MGNNRSADNRSWRKIVLTGGPCAGKTTSLARITQDAAGLGWRVFVINETATELRLNGVAASNGLSVKEFQRCVLQEQLAKERIYEALAERVGGKVLILCDRGTLDGKAFVERAADFEDLASEIGSDDVTLRDAYDGVVYLVTAADGALDAYGCTNNAVRTESDPADAVSSDRRLMAAWAGHPRMRVIGNDVDTFAEKVSRASAAVREMLGGPIPHSSLRRFLVKVPDGFVDGLRDNGIGVDSATLVQDYLPARVDGATRRIRRRDDAGTVTYYVSTRRQTVDGEIYRDEKPITSGEWGELRLEKPDGVRTLRKVRHSFVYRWQYEVLDEYEGEGGYGIMSVELAGDRKRVTFPHDVEVVREITGDADYDGERIARRASLLLPADEAV